jgi:hypothetical protein
VRAAVGREVVIAVYTMGRWAAFISPSVTLHVPLAPMDGDAEHICTVYHDGTHDLPNPQRVIGWSPATMWVDMIKYVDERHADDCDKEDEKR